MAKYCPYCGRSIPDDSRYCPYCEKALAMHEGIKQPTYHVEEKKDKTLLIVAIVLILVIIIPIAIAATVYVYVSGMIGPSSDLIDDMYTTPQMAAVAQAGYGEDSKNATIKITTINSENDINWYYFTYELYDVTDDEELSKYSDYTVSYSSYGPISAEDEIEINGEGNELESGHEYSFSIIYYLNHETVVTVNWTQ